MENKIKYLIITFIAMILIGGGIIAYITITNTGVSTIALTKTTTEIYTTSNPLSVYSEINRVTSSKNVDRYDNATINWLKSLDDTYVIFRGRTENVVMKRAESSKINRTEKML